MPITNIPLIRLSRTQYIARPYLSLAISNPNNKSKSHFTNGIIDTGADECAVPAYMATLLGFVLEEGKPKKVVGLGGEQTGYTHETTIDIYHPISGDYLYTVRNALIDFMPYLNMVLIGVNSFLSKFVLKIDYPKQTFSIKYPKTVKV